MSDSAEIDMESRLSKSGKALSSSAELSALKTSNSEHQTPQLSPLNTQIRDTGIDSAGEMLWGSHFCHFYKTKQDLIDLLVPYMKTGLENNEYCLWVTADMLTCEEAEEALRVRIPAFDTFVEMGAIAILSYSEWYLDDGKFDRERVLRSWQETLDRAISMGFDGVRNTGDTMWLTESCWQEFVEYERAINDAIYDSPILVLCTYSLEKCGALEIADVLSNHECAVMKRSGDWIVVGNTDHKHTRGALIKTPKELEVVKDELQASNRELHLINDRLSRETEHRRRAEAKLEQVNRTLKALSRSNQAMTRATDEEEYLRDVCRIIAEDCGHAMVWIGFAEDDETKSVRPAVHSGLEEGYLEVMQLSWADNERGRGPTGTAIRTGKPSLCRNMWTDPNFLPWRSEATKRGYSSSVVLPLIEGDRAFGAMAIYSREVEAFSEDEVSLLMGLADDLSYGISTIRLRATSIQGEMALREREEHLRLFIEHAPAALALFDTEMKYLAVSRRWMSDYALTDDVIGRSHYDVFPEIGATWKAVHRRCLEGFAGRAENDCFERADGSVQWLRWETLPWRSGDSAIGGIIVFTEDITERKKAEEALAEARNEAERHLSELESFVSSMADGIVLFDAQRKIRMVNTAVIDLFGAPAGASVEEWIPEQKLFTLDGGLVRKKDYPSVRALRGLETTDVRFKMVSPWRESLVSISGAPVRDAKGCVVGGTISFRDVSNQVELEKYHQELYRRELHITEILQGTLVPQDLPQELYGCKLAVKYQPALREAEVGGDFFDVFDLGDGRIGIVIGDVAGKGLNAAVRVAEARYTIRGYASEDASPSGVFTRTNNVLSKGDFEEGSMLTAFIAIVDTVHKKIVYANAGHEPPILISSDSSWSELHTSGIPLGIQADADFIEETRALRPGDRLVMLTDGITEARGSGSGLYGKSAVIEYLVQNSDLSVSEMTAGLIANAARHAGGQLQDDAAVVVFSSS